VAAAVVGAGYGIFLILTALRQPSGAELTGQFALQPAVKALTAVLLAGAALLARLPTPWTALGAASLVLITAGLFFGRVSVPSATSS
jgi:hypothetical protein